ncbi:MAG TPA: hypothetical protein VD794_02265 [Flavisolibacter sp.]|nr:hypothetical protein [Flavisolibacter sp.]
MRASAFKLITQTLQNAIARITKDRDGYFRFGANDKFPNELIDDILSSGTAKSCLVRLSQFIQADGLVDRELSKKHANPKQTFDGLIGDLAKITATYSCVSFRVLYDNMGQPARFYSTPLTELRKRGEYFLYNTQFGTRDYKQTDNKIIHEFNPGESSQSRLKRIDFQIREYGKQIGDLVFSYKKGIGALSDAYPIPDYYSESAINDIRSDAAIARLENRNIIKGFRTPVIISTGPIDNVQKDDDGKTAFDYFEDVIMSYTGEEAASVIHLEAESKEQMAQITTIPIAEIIDATEKATERIGKKVCRHFNVAPPLVGFSTPGQLGNNQELKNHIKLMNMSVIGYQQMITEALSYVVPNVDWSLTTLKVFDFLPQEAINILTEEEIREMYELKPRENEATEVGV